jgi:hypothetical protein
MLLRGAHSGSFLYLREYGNFLVSHTPYKVEKKKGSASRMTKNKELKSHYLTMFGKWVISDSTIILWDSDESFNPVPFKSIASAVRYIQAVDNSQKKSLKTIKTSETSRIYKCRNSDGYMNEYHIYQICEENLDLLIGHDSEFTVEFT